MIVGFFAIAAFTLIAGNIADRMPVKEIPESEKHGMQKIYELVLPVVDNKLEIDEEKGYGLKNKEFEDSPEFWWSMDAIVAGSRPYYINFPIKKDTEEAKRYNDLVDEIHSSLKDNLSILESHSSAIISFLDSNPETVEELDDTIWLLKDFHKGNVSDFLTSFESNINMENLSYYDKEKYERISQLRKSTSTSQISSNVD